MTIKELRAETRLSKAKMAELLGVKQTTISLLETGKMKMSFELMMKIQETFGLVLDPMPEVKPEDAPEKESASKQKYANKIIIKSPLGGEITPEEIVAKLPAAAKKVYVRVDQNKLWWVSDPDSGSVDIWE